MNRRFLRLLLLATALAPVACAGTATRSGGQEDAFDRGCAAYKAGQYQAAADYFSIFLRSDPGHPSRAEVYYWRGLARVHLNQPAEAAADFRQAVQSDPHPSIASLAWVALGNLYYETGCDTEAVAAYARGLKDPPAEVPVDRVLLRTAISLQRLGRWAPADHYLAWLVEHRPGTPIGAEALRRYRAGAFSVQTGAFASRQGAESMARRLAQAGFQPAIGQTVRSRQPLHVVQVGSAPTYPEAVALARKVSQAGFTAMVVP